MGRHREPSAPQQPTRPGRRASTIAMGASALLVAGVTVGVVQTLGAPPTTLDTTVANAAYSPAKVTWPTAKPTAKPTATAGAREGRKHHRKKHRHHASPRPTAPGSTAPTTAPSSTAPSAPSSTAPTTTAPSSTAPTTAPTTTPTTTAPSSTAPSSTAPSSTAPSSTAPSSTAPTSTAPTSTAPTAAPGAGTAAQQVVDLTNAERAKAGCGPLAINAKLTSVAQAHSADMAAKGYFAHEDQSGKSPFDRMTAAGYSFRTAGENIAAGQTSPSAVVTAWMNSAGHRANILNCAFTEIGVGYVTGGSYRYYWTQDFGTPR